MIRLEVPGEISMYNRVGEWSGPLMGIQEILQRVENHLSIER